MDFGDRDGRASPGISDLRATGDPPGTCELSRESLVWPVSTAGLDWLPLPTLVLSADGSAIAVNGAWAAMSGISPGDSRGSGWRQAVDPADRDALSARLRAAAAAGEPGSAGWRLAGGHGGRWSRWWWRPGPVRGLVVCVTDGWAEHGGEPGDRRSRAASEIDQRIELTGAVIQRISWVALILASAASLAEGQAAERVHNAVDELDALIHDIRASVFPLLIPPSAAAGT